LKYVSYTARKLSAANKLFATQIILDSLTRPFEELSNNTNTPSYHIKQEIEKKGYPYGYNFVENKLINTFENSLLDSSKTIRAVLWNSISIVSTIITSD
jgi:chaperonin GroEL (HSP60 family)